MPNHIPRIGTKPALGSTMKLAIPSIVTQQVRQACSAISPLNSSCCDRVRTGLEKLNPLT